MKEPIVKELPNQKSKVQKSSQNPKTKGLWLPLKSAAFILILLSQQTFETDYRLGSEVKLGGAGCWVWSFSWSLMS